MDDKKQKQLGASPATTQDDGHFEFKPLDLSSLGAPAPKMRTRKSIPCLNCGNPACPGSFDVDVEEGEGSR